LGGENSKKTVWGERKNGWARKKEKSKRNSPPSLFVGVGRRRKGGETTEKYRTSEKIPACLGNPGQEKTNPTKGWTGESAENKLGGYGRIWGKKKKKEAPKGGGDRRGNNIGEKGKHIPPNHAHKKPQNQKKRV